MFISEVEGVVEVGGVVNREWLQLLDDVDVDKCCFIH